ncbi:hypothetical protein HMPREF9444_00132 [Succinatimonas hippei YIT 12066]|uniref:Uncharacterized protein n=1 Tax=Succinatimonas hippei (strain DSM 22608 / JCM 16073 / KCTC 15190 / YIT 12066) TaxID=762983 RepID=E8LHL6_SUCHY|nr:hypothetical protein HMPREF9444_00132 [Succinatimonas hippei YIT 12066]
MDENSIKKAFNCTDEQIIEAKTNIERLYIHLNFKDLHFQ